MSTYVQRLPVSYPGFDMQGLLVSYPERHSNTVTMLNDGEKEKEALLKRPPSPGQLHVPLNGPGAKHPQKNFSNGYAESSPFVKPSLRKVDAVCFEMVNLHGL